MTEWKLSVRLTGQGSSLSRTLRDISRDARRADGDIKELKRSITSLRAESRRPIRLKLSVDADGLRSDVRRAIAEIRGEGLDLRLGVDARRMRADVRAAIRDATAGQRIRIPIGLQNPYALRRDVDRAVRIASRNATVRVRIRGDDDTRRNTPTPTPTPTPDSSSSSASSSGFSKKDMLLLAQVLVPVAAATAEVTKQFLAGAAGATAFGIAVAGQVKTLAEATQAETAYKDAVAEHGVGSQEAAEAQLAYTRTLAKMPPATRKAAAEFSVLKDEYRGWSDSLSGKTMEPVIHGLELTRAMLPKLTPMVGGAADAFDRLIMYAAGKFSTPGFDRLMDKLSNASTGALNRMVTDIVRLSEGASGFSGNSDLQKFMDLARTQGPLVGETLGNLVEALVHVLAASGDAGVSLLKVANAFAQIVNSIPSGALTTIVGLATALKLVSLASAGMGRLGTAATNMRGAATSMTAMKKAGIGLGVIGVGALALDHFAEKARGAAPDVDRLTTSLKNLANNGTFTGELKKSFGNMDGLVDDLRDLRKARAEIEKAQSKSSQSELFNFENRTNPVGDWFWGMIDDFKKGEDSANALEGKFKSLDKSLAQLASSGNASEAAESFAAIRKAMLADGWSEKDINKTFSGYKDVVASLKAEQESAARGMGGFGEMAQATSAKLEAQKQSADGLRQSIMALNDVNRAAYDAEINYQQAVDDLDAAFKKNGNTLNTHTEAGRNNARAMSAVAKANDEMIASGVAAGDSFATMSSKSEGLRAHLETLATKALGSKKAAQEYVNTLMGTPAEVRTAIRLEKEAAQAGLRAVQAEIQKTPGAKSVVVKTLNASAIAALNAVGIKTEQLKDGRTRVYTSNGQSLGAIGAVVSALARLDGMSATTYTNHVIRTQYVQMGKKQPGPYAGGYKFNADGGTVDYYAQGGMREKHVAQIAPAGSYRVWAEQETGGESYIPLSRSKRPRSRAIAEETVRRLGGDPASIAWYADGGLDFNYSNSGGGANKYTLSGLISASNDKKGNFSLSIFTSKLRASNNALDSWRANLARVASRAGQDVADALEEMGDDGIALTKKMATGSSKYLKDMAAQLRNLAGAAKASLSEYTSQLNSAVKDQATFQKNLITLAGQGYGSLAARLAADNNEDAEALAASAVKSKTAAAAANKASLAADKALSSEQMSQLVQIIAAITSSKVGIHDVAATTGLGEDDIITVATKAQSQISGALGSRSTKFLADLGRANKHLSYANGGIRAGLYATKGGAVTFAEPSTGGEAYIPLGANKRASATNVLGDVAGRFGLGLVDARAGRPVVIVKEGHTYSPNVTVTGGPSEQRIAKNIAAEIGWSYRRAMRGGVNFR